MKQLTKYGIALFVSAYLLAVLLGSCGDDSCKAVIEKDKLSALIGQLQGQCCVYEANPYGSCQKKSEPFVPGLKYRCVSSAARCLGAMGSEAQKAVPALIEALETGPNNYDTGDGPIPTRSDIIIALGKIGDPRAVKPLIAALHSPRPVDTGLFPRSSGKPRKGYDGTIEALGLIGPAAREAVPHIIPFLKESNSDVFRSATTALGQIKDPRAISPLIEALNHPTDAASSAEALGEFGGLADEAAPILIEKLKNSPDMHGNIVVANAIGKIRGEAAIPRVIYWDKIIDFKEELQTIFREYSLSRGFTANFVLGSDNEEYSQTLRTSEKLFVRLDRTQFNSTLTSGQVWIEKNGKKVSIQKFYNFKEMREIIKRMLMTRKAGR